MTVDNLVKATTLTVLISIVFYIISQVDYKVIPMVFRSLDSCYYRFFLKIIFSQSIKTKKKMKSKTNILLQERTINILYL